jgi:hypothetical protein
MLQQGYYPVLTAERRSRADACLAVAGLRLSSLWLCE